MRRTPDSPRTGLLLSGGIDSAVLLAQLLESGWQVVPFYVRTGCTWETEEFAAVRSFMKRIERPSLEELVVLEMPLDDVYSEHWSLTGIGVPDDHTPDEAVFLPGRNPLLLIKPAVWCQLHGIEQLAIATLAANPFSDAKPKFFNHFEAMLTDALGDRLQIMRPLAHLSKSQVLDLGRHLPLEFTFSCLAPVAGVHCGQCNKCAERQRAFLDAGIADRTRYAAGCLR